MPLHELSFQNNLKASPFDCMCSASFANLVFDAFKDILTTVVYLKQNKRKIRKSSESAPDWYLFKFVISVCSVHCKNDDLKEKTIIYKSKIKRPLYNN